MGKEIIYRKFIKNRYEEKKETPLDNHKKNFFMGAERGFALVEFLDKKYEEIMNDFSNLFKRR